MLANTLRELAGLRFKDEDGKEQVLTFQPPATEAELQTIEARLPCRIPYEIREALTSQKGWLMVPLTRFPLSTSRDSVSRKCCHTPIR